MSKGSLSAYFETAKSFVKSKQFHEARRILDDILKVNSKHVPSHLLKCKSLILEGKLEEANRINSQAIEFIGTNANLLLQSVSIALKLNQEARAKSTIDALIHQYPKAPQILFHAGIVYRKLDELDEAKTFYEKVLELEPDHVMAANNLANIYQLSHQYDAAISIYDRLIERGTSESLVYANKASLMYKLGVENEALLLFDEALKLDEYNITSLYNLSLIHFYRHEFEQSRKYLTKGLKVKPLDIKLLCQQSLIDYTQGEREPAKKALAELTTKFPNEREPFLKLARILLDELAFEEVTQLLESYTQHNPTDQEVSYLLGVAHEQVQQFSSAERYLIEVTDHPLYGTRALMTLQGIYSKTGRLEDYYQIMEKVSQSLESYVLGNLLDIDIPVYNLAYYPFEGNLQQRVLKRYAAKFEKRAHQVKDKLKFTFKKEHVERLRIGYISPNFRLHPDALLTKDLFKYHDRSKFEIWAFSLRNNDDQVADYIKNNADHFEDLSELNNSDAARKIYDCGIHILTCLSGYNLGMRMDIPALRPAPLQTMYMGYNETTQANFIDYVFGDDWVLTPEIKKGFSESIVNLPVSYFTNSIMKPTGEAINRAKYNLPGDAFIFGCLNHPRKLSPEIVYAWAEILKNKEKSVLWMYMPNAEGKEALKTHFKKLGVDPSRIICCKNVPYEEHLNRFKLINLFLDTTVYNGHTTSMEALWMNVPVLTVVGERVSSRICSSILKSLTLDELIAFDIKDYVAKAIELAKSPSKLSHLRIAIQTAKKEQLGVFDIQGKVANLENAYDEMWKNYLAGNEPIDIRVV